MVFLESASFADQFYTMGSHQMLIVLLVIIVANYIFSQLLDWLNFKHSKEELPPEAEGIFDEVQYINDAGKKLKLIFGQLILNF